MPTGMNPCICKWPDTGGPPEARVVLDELVGRVEAAFFGQELGSEQLLRILDRLYQCGSPYMRIDNGQHICHGADPKPAYDELREIQEHADDPGYVGKGLPNTPAGHWETIAQELESFPSAVPVPPEN